MRKIKERKRLILLLLGIVAIIDLTPSYAYMVKYKEDWYKLYHIHYQQYPDDCIENIYWLERAARADYANPLYAYQTIKSETEWEKYRYLFQMHINLKLVEQHLRLGRIYDKYEAHFYDAPHKDEYLRNIEKALSCYKAGLYYWQEAVKWRAKAGVKRFYFVNLSEVQFWEDEAARIEDSSLDYDKMLTREIKRVESVKEAFMEMEDKY